MGEISSIAGQLGRSMQQGDTETTYNFQGIPKLKFLQQKKLFLRRHYLFKVNNVNNRKMCDIFSKLTKESLNLNRFHTLFGCFCC